MVSVGLEGTNHALASRKAISKTFTTLLKLNVTV